MSLSQPETEKDLRYSSKKISRFHEPIFHIIAMQHVTGLAS